MNSFFQPQFRNLKVCFTLLLFFWASFFYAQSEIQPKIKLSLSPNIDTSNSTNQSIIESVQQFVDTKNNSLTENRYWLESDFQKHPYPFWDLYKIEDSKWGKNFYQPTIMEILPTQNPNRKIVKIAWLGHRTDGGNQIKFIHNIVANTQFNPVLLSNYLDVATENWTRVKNKNLTYIISPNKTINQEEIKEQLTEIKKIEDFLDVQPLNITYISCKNPVELYNIKGFDYHPMMYKSQMGGMADYGNIVFSGNNSEKYSHEIVHLYTQNKFANKNSFFDEGLATLLGGSGKQDYLWHRNKIQKLLTENKNLDLRKHLEIYNQKYYEEESPIAYMVSALILEKIYSLYGKAKMLEVINTQDNLWITLKPLGITQENFNREIRAQLQKPGVKFLQ